MLLLGISISESGLLDKGDAERENWVGLATESSEFKLSQERKLTKTHLYEMVCRSVRGKEMSQLVCFDTSCPAHRVETM